MSEGTGEERSRLGCGVVVVGLAVAGGVLAMAYGLQRFVSWLPFLWLNPLISIGEWFLLAVGSAFVYTLLRPGGGPSGAVGLVFAAGILASSHATAYGVWLDAAELRTAGDAGFLEWRWLHGWTDGGGARWPDLAGAWVWVFWTLEGIVAGYLFQLAFVVIPDNLSGTATSEAPPPVRVAAGRDGGAGHAGAVIAGRGAGPGSAHGSATRPVAPTAAEPRDAPQLPRSPRDAPSWLTAVSLPGLTLRRETPEVLGLRFGVPRGWGRDSEDSPGGQGSAARVVLCGGDPAGCLVVDHLSAVDPADDIAQWVDAPMTLLGVPDASLFDPTAESRLSQWSHAELPPGAPDALRPDVAHAWWGARHAPHPPSDSLGSRSRRVYVLAWRKGRRAWKATLELSSQLPLTAARNLVEAWDDRRAGAILGSLEPTDARRDAQDEALPPAWCVLCGARREPSIPHAVCAHCSEPPGACDASVDSCARCGASVSRYLAGRLGESAKVPPAAPGHDGGVSWCPACGVALGDGSRGAQRRRPGTERTPPVVVVPPEDPTPGQEWTNPLDGSVMLWVPPGEFTMGSDLRQLQVALTACKVPPEEHWHYLDETPAVRVWLDGY